MSDSELAVVSVDSFPAPALITRASPTTRKKFFEFFTVPIRNANTRAAYYRAILESVDKAYQEAVLNAAIYIEHISVGLYVPLLG
jgi:hypothetical protein